MVALVRLRRYHLCHILEPARVYGRRARSVQNIEAIEGLLTYNYLIADVLELYRCLIGNDLVASIVNVFTAPARLNSAKYIVRFAAKQLDRYKSKDTKANDLQDMLAKDLKDPGRVQK